MEARSVEGDSLHGGSAGGENAKKEGGTDGDGEECDEGEQVWSGGVFTDEDGFGGGIGVDVGDDLGPGREAFDDGASPGGRACFVEGENAKRGQCAAIEGVSVGDDRRVGGGSSTAVNLDFGGMDTGVGWGKGLDGAMLPKDRVDGEIGANGGADNDKNAEEVTHREKDNAERRNGKSKPQRRVVPW